MRKRAFIALVGGAAVWSFSAGAQQHVPTVGVLALGTPDPEVFMGALRSGLQDFGYVEDQNIRLMLRTAQGKAEQLPQLAAELVRLNPDIIVAFQTPAVVAASRATADIPIVMGTGDPAVTGRVDSLAHPGGNITGVMQGVLETAGKTIELIRELLPSKRRVAVLANATDPFTKGFLAQTELGGRAAGTAIVPIMVSPGRPFDPAFEEMQRNQIDVVIVQPSLLNKEVAELALKYRLPSFSPSRVLPVMGGFASYAARVLDVYRESATYVDKILKGNKPGDLPIALPTKFELVINLKTAKALGITVSPMMLSRADEVIE